MKAARPIPRRGTTSLVETGIAERVRAFYEANPYPPPVDDLEPYRRRWNDPQRRRTEHHLHWPARPFRERL